MQPRYWKRHVFRKGLLTIEHAELAKTKYGHLYGKEVMIERTSGGYFRLVKMTPVWR